jgi:hypothetical protein
MIAGFEDITFKLTESEMKLVPEIAICLSRRVGVINAISNAQIAEAYKQKRSIIIPGPRIRKIISYIFMKEMVPGLVATSKGYYVSTSITELQRYDKSLEGRENAIHARRVKVQEYIKSLQK